MKIQFIDLLSNTCEFGQVMPGTPFLFVFNNGTVNTSRLFIKCKQNDSFGRREDSNAVCLDTGKKACVDNQTVVVTVDAFVKVDVVVR